MHITQPIAPILIDEKAAAALLSISVGSLRADRLGDKKIPVIKLGRRVRYPVASLIAFANGGAA